MPEILPSSALELASILADSASRGEPLSLCGNNSKRLMAGPVNGGVNEVSTSRLRKILEYEPNDLTVSVEAGMPFSELQTSLAKHGQMIALDPPYAAESTIGGIVASNTSGPLRRGFGTARDLIIGLTFATLEGKLIKTGGMVVKNVAGLDMGKLMIGSFGTLAVVASVNFRVHALPEAFGTFLYNSPDLETIIGKRDQLSKSPLQPVSVDLLSPPAAARLERQGYVLAIRAGGTQAVLRRYKRDLHDAEALSDDSETDFWRQIQQFTPAFLNEENGLVLRISTAVSELVPLLRLITGPSISRAAAGVTYVYLRSWEGVPALLQAAAVHNWTVVVEFAPDEIRRAKQLWYQPQFPGSNNAFDMMKKVKHMFDPQSLLNRSRLYGRI